MSNILTPAQAANALRTADDDPRLLDLLPQVDGFIARATGRDWAQDTVSNAVAVSAATMLTVMWFENPGMIGNESVFPFGLTAALSQLEAEALKYRKIQFRGLHNAGGIYIHDARQGDLVVSLVGVYGVSGSQADKFESTISSWFNLLKQTSNADLSGNLYVVILKSP
ncbi:MAG: hypothetical protein ABI904_23245 [Chloroflexota bacterium]